MKLQKAQRIKMSKPFFCFTLLKLSGTVLLTQKLHSCLQAHYFTLPKTKPPTSNSSNTQPDILQPDILILKGFCCWACSKHRALEQLSCLIQHDFRTTWIQRMQIEANKAFISPKTIPFSRSSDVLTWSSCPCLTSCRNFSLFPSRNSSWTRTREIKSPATWQFKAQVRKHE